LKRSEINEIIADAENFLASMKFSLPGWAFWGSGEWKGKYESVHEIVDNMLGWDITDFGGGNYRKRGLFLFTVRNGNIKKSTKPYAEKIMIVDVDQETPMHFHWSKMEDIINRGGGELVIQLYKADKKEGLSDDEVTVSVDGIERKVPAGGKVVLKKGESICLTPFVYHRFYAQLSRCLVGEVSMVNDDAADNRFLDPMGRFPAIEEDEAPRHLLVSDYARYL
jgi:D-lyxose ketol-isomerase